MSNLTKEPWISNRWSPGVLNKDQMQALIDNKYIINAPGGKDIEYDSSALDLHLTDEGYKMKRGSIKPFHGVRYNQLIKDKTYAERIEPIESDIFILEKNQSYIFRLQEELHSCLLSDSPIYGQATAKSSIGRVDVIARLIVDGMYEYESFNPHKLKRNECGEMFLEITPITFNIRIKKGESLSQLRFFYGNPEDSIITNNRFIHSVLNSTNQNGPILSVDLTNSKLSDGSNAVAFSAKRDKSEPIQLWGKKTHNPRDFWNPISAQEDNGVKSIIIEDNNFYILRSKERIFLPDGVAIYCRAMDETIGEMRIHYAGFVHPRFGSERKDNRIGTPLIFEVRGHNVKVVLTDNEILARLTFYRMSKDAPKEEVATGEIVTAREENIYGEQELQLSKFFMPWV